MHMDIWELKARMMERGAALRKSGEDREWRVNQLLFEDDKVLVADSGEKLSNLVLEVGRVCERKNLKGNVRKSKV